MDFDDLLSHVLDLLQRDQRVSYRALKRRFGLDDDYLEDLKDELIYAKQLAVDEDSRVLVWVGEKDSAVKLPSSPLTPEPISVQAHGPEHAPVIYTPAYLAEKILTGKTSLEGERKVVTVLFADVKDSTELIRDLDPEDAQKLLDPAIHIMMEAVHRFEGTVNQVLGDGIMSIFGAPIAHEDHAARACYAALAMQSAMRDYTEQVRRNQGLELRIRVGLNSGEVVVRTIGNDLHMDYSAVGQTTHLAARMEQLASSGTIRLSSSTLRLVEGLVQVNDLGPMPVRGMDEPVAVYELTGASAVRSRLQATAARGLTKFVGRDPEIDALNQALERSRSGNGQLVAAIGEAGMGKSRLVYEFVHSHRTQGWLVLESASVSYGKATPYFPVIDLLKRYVHIEDGDDARTMRAKVTGQILTLDENLHDTIPALLSLLDALPEDSPFLQLDPPQRRQRTLDGLKRVLLRESHVQPLVLVFEDLHWHDSESQAVLNSLVESLPTAPLLLLVNYRPEYQPSWDSQPFYTHLQLDPLPTGSADELLAALLGDDTSLEALKTLLTERTEGNPFFLEESVRMLVETQVLVGKTGAYWLEQALPRIQVPATVQAMLAARIDRLPQAEKSLLQTASVIGTEVPLSLLQAIAEMSEAGLYRGLSNLQASEFLYETSLFPERVYTFKHALTHEVAYGSLLQERRRVLHTRIVEALEILAADRLSEQGERLAHHALRGEIWDKALIYCRQSGAKAMKQSAYQDAVDRFEQALDALRHLPDSSDTVAQGIDVCLDMHTALHPLSEFERELNLLREAETLTKTLGDKHRLVQICDALTLIFRSLTNYERALEYSQRTYALARDLGDLDSQIRATLRLGQIYYDLGDYSEAIECFQENIASLQGGGLEERLYLVRCLTELGDFSEGLNFGEEALRMAEEVDRPNERAAAYARIGFLHLRQGDVLKAIVLLERGLTLSQVAGLRLYFRIIRDYLAFAYALASRTAEALSLLDQTSPGESGIAIPMPNRSEAYLLSGCIKEAHQNVLINLERCQTHQARGAQAWDLRILGEIAMHRDPPEIETGETHYQQALTLASELGMRPLQAHCHCGLGTLYSQTGHLDQARAELSAAIEMYRDMEMTFWLPETEAALAAVEGR